MTDYHKYTLFHVFTEVLYFTQILNNNIEVITIACASSCFAIVSFIATGDTATATATANATGAVRISG